MSARLYKWLDSAFSDGGRIYLKRLSGNDTLLTGSHQAGPYLPKKIIFDLFPSLARSTHLNPRAVLPVRFASDSVPEREVTAIWYNNKVSTNGTRDECRITGWGGKDSPLLDPESTGSIAALSFKGPAGTDSYGCEAWVCSSVEEEELIENRFGPVEPGLWMYVRSPLHPQASSPISDRISDSRGTYSGEDQLSLAFGRPVDIRCRLTKDQVPPEWISDFPTGEAIIEKAVLMKPKYARLDPDQRLLKRRECEYEVFLSIEEIAVMPFVAEGFSTVDAFVDYANSVTNRRKARSGRSLELHLKRIFDEEGVSKYSHDAVSEGRKRPDFLFPSADSYRDSTFPAEHLRMLAAKTCCKDRWRQVADEATRIPRKHLLTLQEGVSEHQFAQMRNAGIVLVVPQPLFRSYPSSIRDQLCTLKEFVSEVSNLGLQR